jgi:hypothetical protein
VEHIELSVHQKELERGIGKATQLQEVAVIGIIKSIVVDEIEMGRVYRIKVSGMFEEVTEDTPSFFHRIRGCVIQKMGKVKELFTCVQQVGSFESGRIQGTQEMAVISRITIQIMIVGLKIDVPPVVLTQGYYIRFHYRLVVRIVQFKGASVEPHQTYLRTQPETTILVEKQIVDAVLRQPAFVGIMLDSVTVIEIGLGMGR